MLKNYFKVAYRNLKKNKAYTFISVFGLALGLAVCALLLLYVQNELSYDQFNKNADNIYRLTQPEHAYHAPYIAIKLADNLPEIKDYVRIFPMDSEIIEYDNKQFKEKNVPFADPAIFRMFSFEFVSGDKETALDKPFTTVISETFAHKYFADENPIGKVLKIGGEYDYTVTGVMRDMPQNSHFRYDIILTLSGADKVFGSLMVNLGWQNFLVYFELQEGFSKSTFEEKCENLIQPFYKSYNPNFPKYSLQSLKDIHLYSAHIKNDIQPQNSITYVLIFSAIGILILLIACVNYINLLTANATTRMKEIGIKKVIGATRNQLAFQFVGESFLVLFIAFIISLVFVQLSLPVFETLTGKVLSFTALITLKNIVGVLVFLVGTSFIAGFYPAFFLSKLHPIQTLKGASITNKSKFNFRTLLVGVQFTIVIALICSALFMFSQIDYLQNKKLGFDKEFVLTSEINGTFDNVEKYNALKAALLKESIVASVSSGSRVPSNTTTNFGNLIPEGEAKPTSIALIHVHQDYFKTLGIKPVKGRLFSNQLATDIDNAIILNETAVKELMLKGNPIGQSVKCDWPKSERTIVGVTEDINFESLYGRVRPTAFLIDYSECSRLIVKVNPSNAETTINKLQAICSNFYPDEIFEFHFLDDKLENLYQSDKNTFQLMGYLTFLSIFISSMGLFGLALFLMKGRTKEIGIRKVLGASTPRILILLVKDFTKWVLIANIIAWPIAFYAVNKWLQNFAYHIEMNYWLFLMGGFIALLIALSTVSYQAIKAALANPVNSLKNE
ncbi:MAG: ABC transporter permease [Melioribacteraceae bacterium]|nr:ABC transporter permease [Melioribacteraceae bacterium]MCF8356224.1 ABC transporter permease [Melioribacteraceae bacterium]MCF8395631.1 ABC transporter permease [Melioribacteraceae bacterium]MCF8420638.1 ABC transporter permease [Melioribacteraceae bacterium]